MVKQASLLHSGMQILAVGDGEGRNGVWLANQGMGVWSVDVSPVGLEKQKHWRLKIGFH
jgi:2-polyprenyl-3-methyl-5-hydroxy-6-metoxy-1,4-benzoquinol methylase